MFIVIGEALWGIPGHHPTWPTQRASSQHSRAWLSHPFPAVRTGTSTGSPPSAHTASRLIQHARSHAVMQPEEMRWRVAEDVDVDGFWDVPSLQSGFEDTLHHEKAPLPLSCLGLSYGSCGTVRFRHQLSTEHRLFFMTSKPSVSCLMEFTSSIVWPPSSSLKCDEQSRWSREKVLLVVRLGILGCVTE